MGGQRSRSAGWCDFHIRTARRSGGGHGVDCRARGYGTLLAQRRVSSHGAKEHRMNSIIYIIGLIVVILAILSFFGMG